MLKTYKAKSHIGITVMLPSGKSQHVSFSSRTGGGSVFYTANPELQQAIERHPKFGRLFKLAESGSAGVVGEEARPVKLAAPGSAAPIPEPEESDGNGPDIETKPAGTGETVHVPYTNLSDAKDYLASHFEAPRTKMRTKEDIKKYAAEYGVAFDGIDK